MHLSVIVPPGCEDLLVGEGSPVTSVMCFADIARANDDYMTFYADYKGWKVMDNQIYEKQDPLPPGPLSSVAGVIQPDVLIVPDVRGDVDGTLAYAHAYLPHLGVVHSYFPNVNLCGVVQGRTIAEIRRCMDFWAAAPVQMVAVPMRVDGRELSRLEVYTSIVRPLLPSHFKVHLLGVEKWPYDDEERLGRYPEVVSCDTAEPTSAAARDDYISGLYGPPRVNRPADFMTDDLVKMTLHNNKERLWLNFKTVQRKFMAPTVTPMAYLATDVPTTE